MKIKTVYNSKDGQDTTDKEIFDTIASSMERCLKPENCVQSTVAIFGNTVVLVWRDAKMGYEGIISKDFKQVKIVPNKNILKNTSWNAIRHKQMKEK